MAVIEPTAKAVAHDTWYFGYVMFVMGCAWVTVGTRISRTAFARKLREAQDCHRHQNTIPLILSPRVERRPHPGQRSNFTLVGHERGPLMAGRGPCASSAQGKLRRPGYGLGVPLGRGRNQWRQCSCDLAVRRWHGVFPHDAMSGEVGGWTGRPFEFPGRAVAAAT